MAFTDKFIKVPIQAYSIKHEELYGEKEYFDSYDKLDPSDISSYFESITDDVRCTQVYLRSGHSFLANLSIEKFEKLLNLATEKTSQLIENQTLDNTFSRKG